MGGSPFLVVRKFRTLNSEKVERKEKGPLIAIANNRKVQSSKL